MRQYFPKPYERNGGNIKVEIYLSTYASKANLKEAAGIDTSALAHICIYLASLKTKLLRYR